MRFDYYSVTAMTTCGRRLYIASSVELSRAQFHLNRTTATYGEWTLASAQVRGRGGEIIQTVTF